MKILIIGGREFLGRHIVDSALNKGHQLTLFNRGHTNSQLFSHLEVIKGDRRKDLDLLAGRKWDVVIDTCGYVPDNLKKMASVLSGNVDQYIFISSCSVYNSTPEKRVTDELAQIVDLDIDLEKLNAFGKDYGACKYLSEREIDKCFSGTITHIRPGLIVGPYDTTARFPYWIKRLVIGGDTLAPDSPNNRVQFIDARDLADWIVLIAEKKIKGIFNAVGPSVRPVTIGEFLDTSKKILGSSSVFKWVSEEVLRKMEISCWTGIPLWVYREIDVFVNWSAEKGILNGLQFRSMEETIFDTWNWVKNIDIQTLKFKTIDRETEKKILDQAIEKN